MRLEHRELMLEEAVAPNVWTKPVDKRLYGRIAQVFAAIHRSPSSLGGARRQLRVAPTFVLKYNIRTRSLADPGTIEDVLAVENDVVPFDRADELASKQITRTGRAEAVTKEGLAATLLPGLVSRRKDHGQVSIIISVLIDAS